MRKAVIFIWLGLAAMVLSQTLDVRRSKPPYEKSDAITAEMLVYEDQQAVKVVLTVSTFLFSETIDLSDYQLVLLMYDQDAFVEKTLLPTKFRSEYLNGAFDFSRYGAIVEQTMPSNKKIKAYKLPGFTEDTLELLFIIPQDLYESGTLHAFAKGSERYLLWGKATGFVIQEPYTKHKIIQALSTARVNSLTFMRLLELYNAILTFEAANKAYLEPW